MRHIATIPVFAPYPATGYGFDEESKAMLGGYTCGDVHHPAIPKTAGDYDGRWLFVNDNANNRLARIDLRDFKTHQILGPIPNSSGNHGSAFVTENTEYALVASRFSIPIPRGTYAPTSRYATDYKGVLTGIKIDSATGQMSLGWQILTPPFNCDLAATGREIIFSPVEFINGNAQPFGNRLSMVTASHRVYPLQKLLQLLRLMGEWNGFGNEVISPVTVGNEPDPCCGHQGLKGHGQARYFCLDLPQELGHAARCIKDKNNIKTHFPHATHVPAKRP